MKRNKYSLSHYKLLSCNMGELVPTALTEVLPGDTFKMSSNALVRFGAMLAPVMHPVHVKMHHWFVPHRLVWEDWEDFITGGPDGLNASVFPTINLVAGNTGLGSLADHLGCYVATGGLAQTVSALPFRGYALIFNEWYRDQDLQAELVVDTASGTDTTTSTVLMKVNWAKDYLSTSRPWTQKGPSVTIPLQDTAPVVTNEQRPTFSAQDGTWLNQGMGAGQGATNYMYAGPNGVAKAVEFGDESGLQTDLSNAGGLINDLRLAFALQRYEEARARYGSRYTEYLRYLGVKSSDARLQRPEYLGGGKNTIQFSEVLATAEGTNTEVGDLKGHGIGAARSNKFLKYFEEHGYIYSFMSVAPIPIYANGMDRTWFRRTKEDFFQKELQYIGQQEVKLGEVDASVPANRDNVFGYNDRYAEYRQGFHRIGGDFRDALDYWHLARIFGSPPSLNSAFVECSPTDRIFATTTQPNVQAMIRHNIAARRLVGPGGRSFVY